MNNNIDLVARLLHKEFREWIQLTKSKIATYTLASYDLVNKYTIEEDEDSIIFKKIDSTDEEDLSYLIDDVWNDYTKLTEYLFELDPYDKDYEDLNDKCKSKFIRLAEKIMGGELNE